MVDSLFTFSFEVMQTDKRIAILTFIRKFTLFVITIAVLDFAVGCVLRHYYFKLKYGMYYRTSYAIDSTRANVLIFGSSKATHNYVPSVFENKTHTTFYNCGRDGTCLIYSTAVMSAILQRYTPQHIIIDLTPYELCGNEKGLLSPLLPYYNNPAIAPFLKYNGDFEQCKLISKMYPYNSMLASLVIDNSGYDKQHHSDDKGYLRLDNVMPDHPKKQFKVDPVSPARINVLNNLLQKLSQTPTAVTVIISPTYYYYNSNNLNLTIIDSLCHKYHVQFLNYENNQNFANHELYNDETHLNANGAAKFSEEVADKILSDESIAKSSKP